jgi:hypothetical protein
MDAAEKGMKAAEESGSGMLTAEYWSNLGDYAKEYYSKLKVQSKAIGATFVESMSSGIDTISNGLASMLQKNEFSWKNLGVLIRNTFSDIFKDLAAEFMKMALRMAMFGNQPAGGGGGFGGLLGAAISIGSAFMGGGGSTLTGNEAGIINNAVSQAELANTFAPQYLAKGGVMTEYGPLKLNKYANGGIADSPQVAIYGEGSQNEAYVPLPDNRSIPVTLTGNSGGVTMGDTYINVKVDGTGTAETDVQSPAEVNINIMSPIFNDAFQIKKFRITPPNKPHANCILPIIALAVPARAPCLDIAKAIAFGPVNPIPDTTKNKPNINIHNGALCIDPANTTHTAPRN